MSLGRGLLYIFPLLVSGFIGAWLALFILRNRRTPSSKALFVLILASALWSFGYAMEFLAPGLEAKLFWAKIQYIGIARPHWPGLFSPCAILKPHPGPASSITRRCWAFFPC
jgi:hypothetical protein